MADFNQQKFNQEIIDNGAFTAIQDAFEDGLIDGGTASNFVAKVFAAVGEKAEEARSELRHLDSGLTRILNICNREKRPRPFRVNDPGLLNYGHELGVFDAWMISLYETELSMLFMANPKRARAKPMEMHESMQALYAERIKAGNLMLKNADLFKLG